MASELLTKLQALADVLKTTGVFVTLDARQIAPPCVFVMLHDLPVAEQPLCGDLVVRADVCLIVGDFTSTLALEALGGLLDRIKQVIDWEEDARPAALTPPGVKAPIPALVLTTTTP